jgi:hypothetical protein
MTIHFMRSSHAYRGMRDFSLYLTLGHTVDSLEVRP